MELTGSGIPIDLSLFEQVLLVGTAFVLKPFYMLLTLRYLVRFRRVRAPELRVAWSALAWFLAGETACGLNYLVHGADYSWIQMSHDAGMVITFALLARVATMVLDRRVLRFSSPVQRCSLLAVCRTCAKYRDVRCAIASAQAWIIGTLALLTLLPLTVPVQPVCYETIVFGQPTVLEHGWLAQIVEIRILPALGLSLLLAAMALAGDRPGRPQRATFLTVLALGPAGFSWLRILTAFPFLKAIVWMGFWEEATETAMVYLIGAWMGGWSSRLDRAQDPEGAPPGP